MIGDNKSCECLRAQNVFAHKWEFVAFQETLRANTWFQRTRAFSFLRVTTRTNLSAVYFVALFPSFQSTFQNTKIIIAFASDIISLLTNRMRKFRRVLINFDPI